MTHYVDGLIAAGAPVDAATYLAWVAYPSDEGKNPKFRRDFVRACAAAIHKANKGGHAPRELRGWRKRDIVNTINRGLDRINKRRFRAVWMALHQWHISEDQASNGWGLNQAARLLLDSAGTVSERQGPIIPETETGFQNDDPFNPGNVKRLIWYESLPALPMTLALPLNFAERGNSRSALDLLTAEGWVGYSIDVATRLAPIIQQAFNPKELVIPRR